jgi:hypothetical protein
MLARTIAFNHERFNHIMADQLEVGVANPMVNGGFRPSEEVVEDSDFMAEQHKSVD